MRCSGGLVSPGGETSDEIQRRGSGIESGALWEWEARACQANITVPYIIRV